MLTKTRAFRSSMNEDTLTRLPITLVGVGSARGLVLDLFADRGAYPTGERDVCLVFGEAALKKTIGAVRFRASRAPTKYGTQRLTYRSSWHPYCFQGQGGWVVSAIHPSTLPRTRWLESLSLEAAVDWAIHLAKGRLPVEPPSPHYRTQDWVT